MSKDITVLVEEISALTVLEMAKLKELLESKWGVKAASGMPMMAMAAPVGAAAAEPAAESSAGRQSGHGSRPVSPPRRQGR